ncbi:hypothetical protein BH11PLA2_BH11PLA2_29470 [soil metagenome]
MPRFAVLLHDWPSPHYDLLLEADGVLKTWRLAEPPRDGVRVEPISDHRLLYLDYEGAVSGNRGSVTRFDGGELTWFGEEFELHGATVRGRFAIVDSCLATSRLKVIL